MPSLLDIFGTVSGDGSIINDVFICLGTLLPVFLELGPSRINQQSAMLIGLRVSQFKHGKQATSIKIWGARGKRREQ